MSQFALVAKGLVEWAAMTFLEVQIEKSKAPSLQFLPIVSSTLWKVRTEWCGDLQDPTTAALAPLSRTLDG